MIQGISGMASAGSMPRNCGMQGMHGNTQTKQALKTDDSAVEKLASYGLKDCLLFQSPYQPKFAMAVFLHDILL